MIAVTLSILAVLFLFSLVCLPAFTQEDFLELMQEDGIEPCQIHPAG